MSVRTLDRSGYWRCLGGALWLATLLFVMHSAGLAPEPGSADGIQQTSQWSVEDRKRLPRMVPRHTLQPVEIAAISLGVPPDATAFPGKFLSPVSRPTVTPDFFWTHRRPFPRDLHRAAARPQGFRARAPPSAAA